MKTLTNYVARLLVLLLLCGPLLAELPGAALAADGPADYYVSVQGNDDWSGTLAAPNGQGTDGPFLTLGRARDVVRAAIAGGMTGDIVVHIRGGDYYMQEPIVFDESDSGRDGFYVHYAAYPGEKPVFYGGLPVTGWQPYAGGIYKANVGTGHTVTNLYENGVRSVKARYPNTEYNRVAATVTAAPFERFRFADTGLQDIPAISDLSGLQIYTWPGGPEGYWAWFANTLNVKSIDYEQKLVTLERKAQYEMGAGSRYYLQGSLELLDSPGEFYYDKSGGDLYYMPYQAAIEQQQIVMPILLNLFEIRGSSSSSPVSYIQFEGLTLTGTRTTEEIHSATVDTAAFYLTNAEHIVIKGNEIRGTGRTGIHIQDWAQYNELYGNRIHDMGSHGIRIKAELSQSYVSKFNQVVNNEIYNTGKTVGHGAGINIYNSGDNRIAHNKIRDTTRYAISINSASPGSIENSTIEGIAVTRENARSFTHASGNRIEFNDVSAANTDSQDTGVINMWGVNAGNIIHNNHIHSSGIPFSFGFGIYLDDGSDGGIITNNIVENLQQAGGPGVLKYPIYLKGIGSEFRNNIVADNKASTAAFGSIEMLGEPNRDLTVERNIFYESGNGRLYGFDNWADNRLAQSDYNLVYHSSNRYEVIRFGPQTVYSWDTWRSLQDNKYDQHTMTGADPMFMDRANRDYRLRYDSPAYALGFEDIDMAGIGLLPDFPFADQDETLGQVHLQSGGHQSTIPMRTGEQTDLTVTGRTVSGYAADLSQAAISYSSSDPAVAAVDSEGRITAGSVGVAMLTALVDKDGIAASKSVYVIVNDETSEAIDEVSLTVPDANLLTGQKMKSMISARTVLGQYADLDGAVIEYTSSNSGVLSVSGTGEVTGVAPGTAELTATVTIGGLTRSDTVTIRVHDVMLSRVQLAAGQKLLQAGGTTQLDVTGTLSNTASADLSSADIAYGSSDPSIAVVDPQGSVTAVGEGIVRLTAAVTLDGVARSAVLELMVAPATGSQLPDGWQLAQYGVSAGYIVEDGEAPEAYRGVTDGKNVFGNADDFMFLYKPVSGQPPQTQTSLTMTVSSVKETSPYASVGLMFRESAAPGSRNVTFRILPSGELRFTYRLQENATTNGPWVPTLTFPAELKLVKEGDVFTALYKHNGQWVEAARQALPFGSSFLAGSDSFSVSTEPTEAKWSDLTLTEQVLSFSKVELSAERTRFNLGSSVDLHWQAFAGSHIPLDLPGATISYSSNNPDVATVDTAGRVTGVGTGSAQIVASVTHEGVTVQGELTVVVYEARLSRVDLSGNATSLNAGDVAKLQVQGLLDDGSAADLSGAEIIYTSGDNSIATIDSDGWVTAQATGIVVMTAAVDLDGTVVTKSIQLMVNKRKSFSEDFEQGLDTSIWKQASGIPMPQLSTAVKRSGQYAVRAEYDGEYMSRSFGGAVRGIYEAWFYDDGVKEGQASVGFGDAYVGTSAPRVPDRYYVKVGVEYTETSVPLETGWHQVVADYTKEAGYVSVYIDGQFVHRLASGGLSWISVGNQGYKLSPVNLYVDDIAVYVDYPVLTGLDLSANPGGLLTGQTAQLTVAGLMDDGSSGDLAGAVITYASSAQEVAQVDASGLLTAKRGGLTTVTVTVNLRGVTLEQKMTVIVHTGKVFEEQFEGVLTDQWSTLAPGVLPSVSGERQRSGSYSLKIGQDGQYARHQLVSRPYKGVYESWFYEDGILETQAMIGTNAALVGTSASRSTTHYFVKDASSNYHLTSAPIRKGWHQIVMDYVSVNGQVVVYLDGAEIFTTSSAGISVLSAGNQGGAGSGYNLYVDDVMVYEMIDSDPPVTTAEVTGTQVDDGYAAGAVVRLQATDDFAGVLRTEYSLDNGGTWTVYTNPIPLLQEGSITILYRSFDRQDRAEADKTLTVQVYPPIPTATVSGPQQLYRQDPVALQVGASGINAAIRSVEVLIQYDASRIEFAAVPSESVPGGYYLAEEAVVSLGEGFQLLSAGIKPGEGRIFVAGIRAGGVDEDGPLFELRGHVRTGAPAGASVFAIERMTLDNGTDSAEAVVSEAQWTITIAELDKAELLAAIANAQAAYSASVEGTGQGQHTPASRAALLSAIQTAQEAAQVAETPEQAEQIMTQLAAAVTLFHSQIIQVTLDDSALASAIAAAQARYAATAEGARIGQYPVERRSELQAAIQQAVAARANAVGQSDLNAAAATLNQALQTYQAGIVTLAGGGATRVAIRDLSIVAEHYGQGADQWPQFGIVQVFPEDNEVTLRILAYVARMIVDDWLAQ